LGLFHSLKSLTLHISVISEPVNINNAGDGSSLLFVVEQVWPTAHPSNPLAYPLITLFISNLPFLIWLLVYRVLKEKDSFKVYQKDIRKRLSGAAFSAALCR
jgi:hypothetical protein